VRAASPSGRGAVVHNEPIIAPILIGDGIRLFSQKGMEPVRLEKTEVSEAGQITNMRFRFAG
jgi:hypothetical protein